MEIHEAQIFHNKSIIIIPATKNDGSQDER